MVVICLQLETIPISIYRPHRHPTRQTHDNIALLPDIARSNTIPNNALALRLHTSVSAIIEVSYSAADRFSDLHFRSFNR